MADKPTQRDESIAAPRRESPKPAPDEGLQEAFVALMETAGQLLSRLPGTGPIQRALKAIEGRWLSELKGRLDALEAARIASTKRLEAAIQEGLEGIESRLESRILEEIERRLDPRAPHQPGKGTAGERDETIPARAPASVPSSAEEDPRERTDEDGTGPAPKSRDQASFSTRALAAVGALVVGGILGFVVALMSV